MQRHARPSPALATRPRGSTRASHRNAIFLPLEYPRTHPQLLVALLFESTPARTRGRLSSCPPQNRLLYCVGRRGLFHLSISHMAACHSRARSCMEKPSYFWGPDTSHTQIRPSYSHRSIDYKVPRSEVVSKSALFATCSVARAGGRHPNNPPPNRKGAHDRYPHPNCGLLLLHAILGGALWFLWQPHSFTDSQQSLD
ncbi:hypothetical protein BOTBODRAFT_208576 [Botryobasidium botryosum FD-172 SS1]|uniref:Uncharacterized protein n=1 Tax=Botryobasidium botryosum (strain FD-172 SS1) TaxID=930990 RepID=A0A067N179_BOTB1|nr:hypothetical protein BOTBODRAFT_208576 [Botryobasidium botryosum FD-172 SS1]